MLRRRRFKKEGNSRSSKSFRIVIECQDKKTKWPFYLLIHMNKYAQGF